MKTTRIGFVGVLVFLVSASVWLYLQFPTIYNEQKVTSTIENNIPIGTSQAQVEELLQALRSKDVSYALHDKEVLAYFPSTIIMRGWYYVRVQFTFKNRKMTKYKIDRIKI